MLTSNDDLWKNLFTTKYPNESLPTEMRWKKLFQGRTNPISLECRSSFFNGAFPECKQLFSNAVTSFFCNLKWNKKREMVCLSPDGSTRTHHFTQSFGPLRGTEVGFNGPANEREYYTGTGSLKASSNLREHRFCPTSAQAFAHAENLKSSEKQCIPFSLSYSDSDANLVEGNFCTGKVTDVDVGFGNTLGYFSEINDWKSSFRLFCIQSNEGQPIWVGNIPLHVEFKFVSIDTKDIATWECGNNRHLCPFRKYDSSGHYSLERNLKSNPVRFPH